MLAGARPQLEALGGRLGALFATSMMARGFFSGSHSTSASPAVSPPHSRRGCSARRTSCSRSVPASTRGPPNTGASAPSAGIVHCDLEASAIGRIQPVTLGVIGDAAETAGALLDELDRRGVSLEGFRTEAVVRDIESFRWEDEFEEDSAEGTVDPRSVLMALDGILPEERTVAVDCGHFAGFPARHLRVPDAAGFVFAEAFQAVGLGLGAGMGAAVARPDRLAVVVVGDGGLLMSLGELDAAVHLGIPLLVVVMNDAGYGAEVHHFRALGLPAGLARFGETDFASIAVAMGAEGVEVRSAGDLDRIKGWVGAPEGVMIDCKVNPTWKEST